MMRIVIAVFAAGLASAGLTLTGPASAFPNGAPWGSADPRNAQNCAACHFGDAAIQASEAVTMSGLPESVSAGGAYEIVLRFKRGSDGPSGFLVGASSGAFSADQSDLEVKGREIRSVSPNAAAAAEWTFNWAAPESLSGPVIFHIGVNAANDDASPFGDEIHFRTIEVTARE